MTDRHTASAYLNWTILVAGMVIIKSFVETFI